MAKTSLAPELFHLDLHLASLLLLGRFLNRGSVTMVFTVEVLRHLLLIVFIFEFLVIAVDHRSYCVRHLCVFLLLIFVSSRSRQHLFNVVILINLLV